MKRLDKFLSATAFGALLVGLLPAIARAEEELTVDSGDTAWILTSSALVLMMTVPGLAFFYGGMVRGKNVLSTLMHSFILMALISIIWVICGYSIAFGPDVANLFGSLAYFGLSGVTGEPAEIASTTMSSPRLRIVPMITVTTSGKLVEIPSTSTPMIRLLVSTNMPVLSPRASVPSIKKAEPARMATSQSPSGPIRRTSPSYTPFSLLSATSKLCLRRLSPPFGTQSGHSGGGRPHRPPPASYSKSTLSRR